MIDDITEQGFDFLGNVAVGDRVLGLYEVPVGWTPPNPQPREPISVLRWVGLEREFLELHRDLQARIFDLADMPQRGVARRFAEHGARHRQRGRPSTDAPAQVQATGGASPWRLK